MLQSAEPMLPADREGAGLETRWFSAYGCVVYDGDRVEVFVGGSLIASYPLSDRGMRNIMLCVLAEERRVRKSRLAQAFGVSPDTVRLVRQQAAHEGMAAVYNRKQTGRPKKVTPALERRLEQLFDQGATVRQAQGKVPKRYDVSVGTVRRAYQAWKRKRATQDESPTQNEPDEVMSLPNAAQGTLPFESSPGRRARPPAQTAGSTTDDGVTTTEGTHDSDQRAAWSSQGHTDEPGAKPDSVVESTVTSGRHVQHVGSWLLLAVVAQLGLHACVERLWNGRPGAKSLRIALDAVIVAFAIGQRCVEGVRRVATPTAPVLLRAHRAPSASWVRRLWHQFVDQVGSVTLHWSMAGVYLRDASRAAERPAVFYVDNHMRPYTGKHTVRRGWRMQDSATRKGWSEGSEKCDELMKFGLSSSRCESCAIRGEPAQVGSEPCDGRGDVVGDA